MTMQRISQIFYPKVDSTFEYESLNKINKKYRDEIMPNNSELQDVIEYLDYVKDERKKWNKKKSAYPQVKKFLTKSKLNKRIWGLPT